MSSNFGDFGFYFTLGFFECFNRELISHFLPPQGHGTTCNHDHFFPRILQLRHLITEAIIFTRSYKQITQIKHTCSTIEASRPSARPAWSSLVITALPNLTIILLASRNSDLFLNALLIDPKTPDNNKSVELLRHKPNNYLSWRSVCQGFFSTG